MDLLHFCAHTQMEHVYQCVNCVEEAIAAAQQEARAEALEEAARMVDRALVENVVSRSMGKRLGFQLADAIRALAAKEPT